MMESYLNKTITTMMTMIGWTQRSRKRARIRTGRKSRVRKRKNSSSSIYRYRSSKFYFSAMASAWLDDPGHLSSFWDTWNFTFDPRKKFKLRHKPWVLMSSYCLTRAVAMVTDGVLWEEHAAESDRRWVVLGHGSCLASLPGADRRSGAHPRAGNACASP